MLAQASLARTFPAMLAIAIMLFSLLPTSVKAQNPLRGANVPADAGFEGAKTRDEILESPRWKKLVNSFDDWMSVQNIYTEGQTAELVRGLKKKVSTMTSEEFKEFIVDTEKRLSVLMSDEAREARSYLSVATMDFRQKMLARNGMMPNVFGMSVAELRQELQEFQQSRTASAEASTDFNRTRQQRVAEIKEEKRAQQQAIAAARSQATQSAQKGLSRSRSPYVPRPNPPRRTRPRFYVNAFGGIGRELP